MKNLRFPLYALILSALAFETRAAIPLQINHQGFIDVGGTAFNGIGYFRFALVDPDTGNNVWTNDGTSVGTNAMPTNPVDLPVINGIYNVRLGDTTLPNMTALTSALFNDDNLELRVWFDDGANGIEVLSPDQPLTSAPYTFHAATADTAGSATTALTAVNATNSDQVDGLEGAILEESAEIDSDIAAHNTDTGAHANIQLDGSNIATGTISNARLDTGAGNGLDADTVDGFEASELGGAPSIAFNTFGGDGSDGVVTVSSSINFSTLTGGITDIYLQTTSFTVDPGQTLTIDTGWAYIGVAGTCTISGIIDADGQGELGGSPPSGNGDGGAGRRADGIGDISFSGTGGVDQIGNLFAAHTGFPSIHSTIGIQQHAVWGCVAGAGGGGGQSAGVDKGGGGGGGGSFGGRGGTSAGTSAVSTPTTKVLLLAGGSHGDNATHATGLIDPIILRFRGAGGGSGGRDTCTAAGAGGSGGGVIFIECENLIFDGMLSANGEDGGTAVGVNCGGGGGGGGGLILVLSDTITTNTGSVTADGGGSGIGGGLAFNGGAGAAGFIDIVDLN